MRVMVIVKATKDSEAGILPSKELLEAMGNYNEQLVKAGIMLAGEGLKPSSKGKRVRFSGSKRSVIDGPFAETKELIAGYWIWQVRSMEEAVEWLKRCPNPMPGESEVEIRPVFEAADFGENLSPEAKEQEERLRKEIAGRQIAVFFYLVRRIRVLPFDVLIEAGKDTFKAPGTGRQQTITKEKSHEIPKHL